MKEEHMSLLTHLSGEHQSPSQTFQINISRIASLISSFKPSKLNWLKICCRCSCLNSQSPPVADGYTEDLDRPITNAPLTWAAALRGLRCWALNLSALLLLLLLTWMPFCFISCMSSDSSAAICEQTEATAALRHIIRSSFQYLWGEDYALCLLS